VTPIRVLVADDEKPARERLRRLLARDERVEIAGCCAGGAEALAVMHALAMSGKPVQVLCLDVQMPELDGFGVLARLVADTRVEMPAVIFVTAHDAFAVRAFESHAVDYLLKPFSDERFQAALDRAIRSIRTRGAVALLAEMQALLGRTERVSGATGADRARPPVDKIVLKGAHRVRLLPVEQISWIEAEGMYVRIHTRENGAHLHRALIGSLEESLDPRQFVRIHRSAIVNIDLVSELRLDAHGDYVAVLRGGPEVRVGRRFRDRLQARLGQSL
jgi:two-component system, LytTR family, response regulator